LQLKSGRARTPRKPVNCSTIRPSARQVAREKLNAKCDNMRHDISGLRSMLERGESRTAGSMTLKSFLFIVSILAYAVALTALAAILLP
jgi:hypothetical protein